MKKFLAYLIWTIIICATAAWAGQGYFGSPPPQTGEAAGFISPTGALSQANVDANGNLILSGAIKNCNTSPTPTCVPVIFGNVQLLDSNGNPVTFSNGQVPITAGTATPTPIPTYICVSGSVSISGAQRVVTPVSTTTYYDLVGGTMTNNSGVSVIGFVLNGSITIATASMAASQGGFNIPSCPAPLSGQPVSVALSQAVTNVIYQLNFKAHQ